jgi:hypothetical protein
VEAFYSEFSPTGAGFEEVEIPFNAHHVVIRHIAGTGVALISFDGTTLHGKVEAPAAPEGPNPFEAEWYTAEGISKVWIKTAAETVSIRAWL